MSTIETTQFQQFTSNLTLGLRNCPYVNIRVYVNVYIEGGLHMNTWEVSCYKNRVMLHAFRFILEEVSCGSVAHCILSWVYYVECKTARLVKLDSDS